MLININTICSFNYYKTALIAAILTMTITPLLWIVSESHTQWVLMATLLWASGSILIFHPFVQHVYPHMLTKMGIYLLTSILTIVSVWFNITIITLLLPNNYIYDTMLNITLTQISLFGWFYILMTSTFISNLNLSYVVSHDEESIFFKPLFYHSKLSYRLLKHISSMSLMFIIPIVILYVSLLSFDFRIFLGVVTSIIGVLWFVSKLSVRNFSEKIQYFLLTFIAVLTINNSFIHMLGEKHIPVSTLHARISDNAIKINFEAKMIKNPIYELRHSNNSIYIYKILVNIPILELQLGYKIETIPRELISIEIHKNGYLIKNNKNKTLLFLK